MSDDDLCLAHYRMMFPSLASLGTGTPPPVWQAEYDRIAKSGLSATLMTSVSGDGGNASAMKNFDQKILLRALMLRRAELDTVFDAAIFAPPGARPRRRKGTVDRVGI
jgi:hypothetical protein